MRNKKSFAFFVFLTYLSPFTTNSETASIAYLKVLDKTFAKTSELKIPVGQKSRFGSLEIIVQACDKSTAPQDAKVFLEIWDLSSFKAPKLIFSSWMFSSRPALSTLEHPLYDVWVDRCE